MYLPVSLSIGMYLKPKTSRCVRRVSQFGLTRKTTAKSAGFPVGQNTYLGVSSSAILVIASSSFCFSVIVSLCSAC